MEELTVVDLTGPAWVLVDLATGNTQQYLFRNNGRAFLMFEVAEDMTCNYTLLNRVTNTTETYTLTAGTWLVGPFRCNIYNDRHDRVLMGIQIPAENAAPQFGAFHI